MTETDTPPRPEFLKLGELYQAELEPWLASQESRRRKARLLRWLIIGGGFALLLPFVVYAILQDWGGFAFFGAFILAIVLVAVGNAPISSLKTDVKAFIMEKLAGFFGFSYAAAPDFPDAPYFTKLQLLPTHDKRKFEDGLEGEIKGIPFRMAEVHLTQRRRSGKNTKDVTVFRGLLLALPHAAAGDAALSVWGQDSDQLSAGDGLREVSLRDPAFDGDFVVHCRDVETAQRLLDADARKTYVKLDDLAGEARLGITDGRLIVAIHKSTDSFEAGKMNRPLADPNRVQEMVELFAIPFDVIDGFKLQPPAAAKDVG